MLLYVFVFQLYLLSIPVEPLLQIETKNAKSPRDMAGTLPNDTVIDVIKNISRVNTALQELIKNYEQLKKIYKTESIESEKDYSTDSEIDEQYKAEKKRKKNRSKPDKVSTMPKMFPATQMTADNNSPESGETSEEAETDGSDSDHNKTENRLPKIENLQAPTASKNKVIKDKKKLVSNDRPKKEKNGNETTKKMAQIFFIDTHKVNNVSQKPNDAALQTKSRVKKIDHKADLRSINRDISFSINVNGQSKNNSANKSDKESKKHLYNPKTLHRRGDPLFKTKMTERYGIETQRRKSKTDVDVPKDKNDTLIITFKNADAGRGKTEKVPDPESDEEEKDINKEMFKTKILRKAYGDSCSKVVVKKCYKACKSALKMSCMGSGCKSSFKEAFSRHARTGCIMEFAPETTLGVGKRTGRTDGAFNKDDFFAAACWPLLRRVEKQPIPVPKGNINESALNTVDNLNILRDRYEKACARASADKCQKACMYSYDQACLTYECPKKRKKIFAKQCDRSCRDSYKPYKKPKSSSSESSSSSSSSSFSF